MNYLEETFKSKLKEYRSFETQMNIDWGGIKRLNKCVDVKLQIKFSKAEMVFKNALGESIVKKKIQMIEMMYRAWDTLIKQAIENGYSKLSVDEKCYQYDKNKVAIVCDSDLQLSNLKAKYKNDKDIVVFSMEELFRFVHPDYLKIKEDFKGTLKTDITFKKITYGKGQ